MLEKYDLVFSSPARAARETAAALGLAPLVDGRLQDIGLGRWAGTSFEQVQAEHADAFAAWLARPEEGAAGGETMAEVRIRIAEWLAEQAGASRSVIAITHPMIVRAALSACLELPLNSVMRFDVAPLSITTLSYNRVWRLQAMGR